MGHFSYSCQLSGLPITSGTLCGIIPMLPSGNYYDNSESHFRKVGIPMFCSNDGMNIFFKEVFFPIFGVYDEYGGLEGIIEDDNTKAMEKYYGLSIEQIVTVLCDGRKNEYESGSEFCESVKILKKKNPQHMQLLKCSLSWIHKGVYDNLANSPQTDNFGWGDKLDLGTPAVLRYLGFKHTGEDKKKDRYTQVWEKDGLKVHADNTWINIPGQSIYSLTDFQKYCKKNNVDIDISEMDGKGRVAQTYDYIIPELKNIKGGSHGKPESQVRSILLGKYEESMFDDMTPEEMDEILDNLKKNGKKEGANLTATLEKKKKEKIDKPLVISHFLFDLIKENGNNFLRKNIVDWHKVKQFFYLTGRYLYPIGTSPQDGAFPMTRTFLNATVAAFDAEMKENKDKGHCYDVEENEDEE